MALYSYKASDSEGKIVTATLEAADEMTAVSIIQAKGYIPMRVILGRKRGTRLNIDIATLFGDLFKRVSGKDVQLFTQDFATLLEAGLPVDRALRILIDVAEDEKFRAIIGEVLEIVKGGGYLSDALGKFPKAFSSFYVNMVRAGETGGVLDSVLKRLGVFLETTQDLKDYIKSALVYPIFLVLVGGVSIIILLAYVIPKFSVIFSDLGGTIPMSTRLLLGASEFLRSYWWILLGVMISCYTGIRNYKKTPAGGLKVDQIKLKIPVWKNFIQKLEVARFTRTLGTLIESGVPILQALDLVRGIIGNKVIFNSLKKVNERVKEGEKLSKPLWDTGVFPPLAIQMITVGEETGRLEEMLLRIADNYEKIMKNMVKRLIGFLEPAMILVMGVIVAFIVISMLMAIFSMNELPF
jgi:general secretion pathway protein F